jgi:hypothetical protein
MRHSGCSCYRTQSMQSMGATPTTAAEVQTESMNERMNEWMIELRMVCPPLLDITTAARLPKQPCTPVQGGVVSEPLYVTFAACSAKHHRSYIDDHRNDTACAPAAVSSYTCRDGASRCAAGPRLQTSANRCCAVRIAAHLCRVAC